MKKVHMRVKFAPSWELDKRPFISLCGQWKARKANYRVSEDRAEVTCEKCLVLIAQDVARRLNPSPIIQGVSPLMQAAAAQAIAQSPSTWDGVLADFLASLPDLEGITKK